MKYVLLPLLLLSVVTKAEMSSTEIADSKKMSFCIGTNGANHNEINFQDDDRAELMTKDSVSIDTSNCSGTDQVIAKIPYLRNYPLNTDYPELESAIIAIHANSGDAESIYNTVNSSANVNDDKLVIAPYFLESSISGYYHSDQVSSIIYWDKDEEHTNWRIGGRSIHPTTVQVSNFQIIDAIISKIVDKLPNLKVINIVGFSAGGQAVQRYSIFNQIDGILNEQGEKITFRYVVAAPATYTYFSEKRYTYGTNAVLNEISLTDKLDCSDDYNGYRYGLENLDIYPYIASVGNSSTDFINNAMGRHRIFIAGENDTAPTSNCRRNLMGSNANEKAFNYVYHLGEEGVAANVGYCQIANKSHQESILKDPSVLRFINKGYVLCSN
jgi:hypothetical protein